MRYEEPKDSPPVSRLTPLIRKSYPSSHPPRDSVSPSAHFRLLPMRIRHPRRRRPDSRLLPPRRCPPSPVAVSTPPTRTATAVVTWHEPPVTAHAPPHIPNPWHEPHRTRPSSQSYGHTRTQRIAPPPIPRPQRDTIYFAPQTHGPPTKMKIVSCSASKYLSIVVSLHT